MSFLQNIHNSERYSDADNVLNAIDDDYGPFFISGGDFGGNLNLHARVDTMYLEGNSQLSAELSADLSGMFQVGGSVNFTQEGAQLFRNSDITIGIYGGSAAVTQNELATFFGSTGMTDREVFQGILNRWAESLKGCDEDEIPSQASPSSRYWYSFRRSPMYSTKPSERNSVRRAKVLRRMKLPWAVGTRFI